MIRKSLVAAAVMLCGAGGANAADVIDTVPVADWTGFYLGAHAGYGWGSAGYDTVLSETVAGGDSRELGGGNDPDGFFAGLQAGYNWQIDALVLGVEGDISKSWMSSDYDGGFVGFGAADAAGSVHTDTDIDWFGTLRLRAGFLASDALLIYGTGGLAWGNVDSHVRIDFADAGLTDISGGDSSTRMGWTLGGGLEYKVSEAWSVKAEYLYVDLGDDDVVNRDVLGNNLRADSDVSFHTVQLGANFHF